MADETKGLSLDLFPEPLHRVPAHRNHLPMSHQEVLAALPAETLARIREQCGPTLTADKVRRIGRSHLEGLTFEQIARFRASNRISMAQSMETMFEEDPRFVLLDRIRTSMHHWGSGRATWNECVDAYEAIRTFSTGMPDFEARLTHACQSRPDGPSDHCSTWLDGHLAFLIHYRGRHVLTLGFSIMAGRRVLVQQVQTTSPRGNRWMFRMRDGVVAFAIDLFRRRFPRHAVHVVDGGDLAEANIRNYDRALVRQQKVIVTLQRMAEGRPSDDRRALNRAVLEEARLIQSIEALEDDVDRLRSMYRACGASTLSEPVTVNRMRHYAIAA